MKKMHLAFDVLLLLLANLVSRIIPRSNNIWVFGGNSGKRFADNSRYLFLYCCHHTDKKCIWLSQDDSIIEMIRKQGMLAYKSNSAKGLYFGFRAKWHIFDVSQKDTSLFSSVGAYQFNTWHGIPIKNLEGLYSKGRFKKLKDIVKSLIFRTGLKNQKCFMAYPNEKYRHQYQNVFSLPLENIIITNQPRNITLSNNSSHKLNYRTEKEVELLLKLKEIKKGNQIFGYFPTWRSGGNENFMGIEKIEDIEALNKLLVENNAYIIAKRHTCSFSQYNHPGYSQIAEENQARIEALSNFIALDYEIDLNSIISECDILISDYSGAIIDYLMLQNPMILYCYDLEEYEKSPGLYFDYREMKFGHLVESMPALTKALGSYFNNKDHFINEYAQERERLKKLFFNNEECFQPIINCLKNIQ